MAKLQGDLLFTGSLGNVTAYRMKGVDRIIIRAKGGPSPSKIRRSPRFRNTRKSYTEFGAAAKAGSWLRNSFRELLPIADHNLTPPLNALCRKIQLLDTDHEPGKREVLFSRHPHLLEGFSLSRRDAFESVLRSPVHYTADTMKCSVTISVPELLPGINLWLPGQFAFYRLVFTLGILPDAPLRKGTATPVSIKSEWVAATKGMEASIYTLRHDHPGALTDRACLVIAAGIQLSVNGDTVVKYGGVGKVLGVVSGQ
jgi:hypothetical protein